MKQLFAVFLFTLLITFKCQPLFADTESIELPDCVVLSHCVRIELKSSDLAKTFADTVDIVKRTPRTEIIEETNSYIHAEAKTRWMHYVDDLEVKAISSKGIVEIRSESRVGIGDNGVNQKRVNDLIGRLKSYK